MSSPETAHADAVRIAQRYPRRTSRGLVWVALPLALLLVGWTVWAGIRRADTGIAAELHGYQVVSVDQIDVTVDIYRPDPSRAASCTVRALALSGQVVGELELVVPASPEPQIRVPASVRTVAEPVTATVGACRLM